MAERDLVNGVFGEQIKQEKAKEERAKEDRRARSGGSAGPAGRGVAAPKPVDAFEALGEAKHDPDRAHGPKSTRVKLLP